MSCPTCSGALESNSTGMYKRCTACGALYMFYNNQLSPLQLPPGTDMDLFVKAQGFPSQPKLLNPMEATQEAFKARAQEKVDAGVRVKVGGVKVDLRPGGMDVDTSRLQRDVEKKVSSTISGWIWGCVGTVLIGGLIFVVFAGILGYVWWTWNHR